MSLDFIDVISLVIAFLTPLSIIDLVIFLAIKLNSIEKKVINLEKLLNEVRLINRNINHIKGVYV